MLISITVAEIPSDFLTQSGYCASVDTHTQRSIIQECVGVWGKNQRLSSSVLAVLGSWPSPCFLCKERIISLLALLKVKHKINKCIDSRYERLFFPPLSL